jgi:hypothetical protein
LSERESDLARTAEAVEIDPQESFRRTTAWWRDFWKRSWIVIAAGGMGPDDPVWQKARNNQLFRYQLGGNVSGE